MPQNEEQIEQFWYNMEYYGEPYKPCPLGGRCYNPACIFGCIEKLMS